MEAGKADKAADTEAPADYSRSRRSRRSLDFSYLAGSDHRPENIY